MVPFRTCRTQTYATTSRSLKCSSSWDGFNAFFVGPWLLCPVCRNHIESFMPNTREYPCSETQFLYGTLRCTCILYLYCSTPESGETGTPVLALQCYSTGTQLRTTPWTSTTSWKIEILCWTLKSEEPLVCTSGELESRKSIPIPSSYRANNKQYLCRNN